MSARNSRERYPGQSHRRMFDRRILDFPMEIEEAISQIDTLRDGQGVSRRNRVA